MSGLAKYLLNLGKRVGGSDVSDNEYTDDLIKNGAKINFGNNVSDVADYEFIIYTDAINEKDLRLNKAVSLSKPVMSRGQFLYEVSRNFKTVIAVSGCHGKTTCTSMLTHIFDVAGKSFASHIGGKDLNFSNFYFCGDDFFITEACEYKKNFLRLKPDVAVILNSDADHIECYGSEGALKEAYRTFAAGAQRTISLYGDSLRVSGLNFGFDKSADYFAGDIKVNKGICAFTVYEHGKMLGRITLNVFGRHNILNALAAIAVARCFDISFKQIRDGLNNFTGVERRFEKLEGAGGVSYYADYAHHPNELSASLKTVQGITDGRLFVVFQPHTYSRTRLLFNQFVEVLSPLNELLIYKTFAAREYFDDAGSALALSQSIKNSHYGDTPSDIVDFISKAEEGDTVLLLGAGDIYFIAKQICNDLKRK